MTEMFAIGGVLRDYDWGIVNGLSRWSGTTTNEPEAELWFGAHPAAPSPLRDPAGSDESTLDQVLGAGQVPLLTKILAAGSPLSIQVHPSELMARSVRQSPEGRALLADDAEKIEMLIALEEFLILAGWREPEDAGRLLRAVGATERVLSAVQDADRAQTIRLLLGDDAIRADEGEWLAAVERAGSDEVTTRVMARVANKFPGDPGVAVAGLLQSSVLNVGDAVYLPAGLPHSYIHGLGVEVMTSSDDVLRMGLTSKTVSVEYAIAALASDRSVELIRNPGDGLYAPAESPFDVQFVTEGTVLAPTSNYRLALALSGALEVTAGVQHRAVSMGEAVVLTPSCATADVRFVGRGVLVTSRRGD